MGLIKAYTFFYLNVEKWFYVSKIAASAMSIMRDIEGLSIIKTKRRTKVMLKNEHNKIVVFDFKEVMLLEEIDDNTTKIVFKNGYVQKLHNSIKEVYNEMKQKLQ